MKICYKCKKEKSYCQFSKCKTRKDGYSPGCKACNKSYREANKTKIAKQKKEYVEKNKGDINLKQRERYYNNRESYKKRNEKYLSNPKSWAIRTLHRSKDRATMSGIEHSIVLEDIIIPEVCPYLKIPLTFIVGQGQLPSNASIDRIDSSLGYIPSNIQVISRLANTMKSNATDKELILFAEAVLQIHQ